MNIDKVGQELKEAFELYGADGDQSLEYYGLVIKDGICSSSKIYRQLSKNIDENALLDDYRNLTFFNAVIELARIYDFSVRYDENNSAYTRLVFAPYKTVLQSDELFSGLIQLCHLEKYSGYFRELTAYYRQSQFTGTSPLLKMGIELSESGEVLEAKAYFALKSYDDRYDNYGRWLIYDECRHLVDKSLELLGMNDLSDHFAEISSKMEQIQYYPVFTGINFSEDYAEMKVYYETCFPDYSFDVILNRENSLALLMLGNAGPDMVKMHAGIQSAGAFIDCVSYSVLRYNGREKDDVKLWKPYYLSLNERLIGKRILERSLFDGPVLKNTEPEQYKSVLLVNEEDEPLGFMQKMAAHTNNCMHRAFSVFLHDGNGKMLIQKRAACKYHSPSLWTNACCSHPLTSHVVAEAEVRLNEELGISGIPLKELFSFQYEADVGNGLIENEYDHVLTGICTEQPELDPSEAEDQKFIDFDELLADVDRNPECYTVWFRLIVERVIQSIRKDGSHGD